MGGKVGKEDFSPKISAGATGGITSHGRPRLLGTTGRLADTEVVGSGDGTSILGFSFLSLLHHCLRHLTLEDPRAST